MRKALGVISAVGALALTGTITAGCYFYNLAIARSRKVFLLNNRDLEGVGEAMPSSRESNWVDEHGYEDVLIKSHDGLKLHGYYIEAVHPTAKTVILAHGYTSQGKHMANFARFYYETLGFNVLMPDDRGHGRSEGDYVGFGWIDRVDYLRWIDYVIGRNGSSAQIVLHGISMGGATVLMTAGEESIPEQVRAVISDCAYTSVQEQLSYQLKRMYCLPRFPIMNATSLITKIRAGYSFEEASALRQVQKARLPILFIHGDQDTFVPFEMAKRLYDACTSEKQLLIIPGAGHGLAFRQDPAGYTAALARFICSYVD